jgi:hypothetical protein
MTTAGNPLSRMTSFFFGGGELALMTRLATSVEAQAKRLKLTHLPSDASIYSLNPIAARSAQVFDPENFQAKLVNQIWKLA